MLLNMLREMAQKRGVSGDEGEIRDYLRTVVTPLADEVFTDTLGNLYAVKNGGDAAAPHILLAAHMDEIGLMVTHITEEGLLGFAPVGGVDPRVLVSKRVLVGGDRVPGVIGAKAIHLQSREDRARVLGAKDLRIDIGATGKSQAEELCPPGSYVTFDSPFVEYGNRMVKSKALDDRVGCLALWRALKDARYPGKLTCVFTVQEEVGLRGATVAAYRTHPDIGIVLEGTTCNDLGQKDAHKRVTRVGAGPVLSFMDSSAIAHPALLSGIQDIARELSIPYQFKQAVAGGTDTAAIQRSREGAAAIAMAVPCRNIHSPANAASMEDIEAEHALLLAVLERFGQSNPLA